MALVRLGNELQPRTHGRKSHGETQYAPSLRAEPRGLGAPAFLSSAMKLIVSYKAKGTESLDHRERKTAAQSKVPVHTEKPGRRVTDRAASVL